MWVSEVRYRECPMQRETPEALLHIIQQSRYVTEGLKTVCKKISVLPLAIIIITQLITRHTISRDSLQNKMKSLRLKLQESSGHAICWSHKQRRQAYCVKDHELKCRSRWPSIDSPSSLAAMNYSRCPTGRPLPRRRLSGRESEENRQNVASRMQLVINSGH